MKKTKKLICLISVSCLVLVTSCKKTWDDYYKSNESGENIVKVLEGQSSLTEFVKYLKVSSYYNQLLNAAYYSIWVPENSSVFTLDINDTAEINNYIGYCLAIGNYESESGAKRLKMLNGKHASFDFDNKSIDGSSYGSPIVSKNGLIYIVDGELAPKKNIWDSFVEGTDGSKQKEFIGSLDAYIFDEEASKPIGVDDVTGFTIYDSVKVFSNPVILHSGDLTSEDEIFTFFVLSDAAFESTSTLYQSYLKPKDSLAVEEMAKFQVCIDLIVNGKIGLGDLPSEYTTSTGKVFTLTSDMVDHVVEASNGNIIFVKQHPVGESVKFGDIVVEGEAITSAKSLDWTIRQADGASGGNELFIATATAGSWAQFNVKIPFPANYKFQWVAVHDEGDTAYYQTMAIYPFPAGEKSIPEHTFETKLISGSYAQKIQQGEYLIEEEKYISIRAISEGKPITVDRIILTPTNQ